MWTFEIRELTTESPPGAGHRIVAMGQPRTEEALDRAARDVAALWLDTDAYSVSVTITIREDGDE